MNSKQKIVKVDIDGVIRDIMSTIRALYYQATGVFLEDEDITRYDVNDVFVKIPDARNFFFEGKNAETVFKESIPFPGARMALRELSDAGFKIVLVTWQIGTRNKTYTLDWLDKWKIPYDDICFTRDKYMIDGNYLIDDNPEFLSDERDKSSKIMIERPYNKEWKSPIFRAQCLRSAVSAIINGDV